MLDGMYASDNFGQTWTRIMDYNQLKQAGTNSALLGEAGYNPGVQSWYNLWVEPDPTVKDSFGYPTRVLFGLEEVWENNQLPTTPQTGTGGVLTSPYNAYPGGTAANDPWVVIGRYWNACGGVSTPVGPCNPSLNASPIPGSTTHPDQHAVAMIPDAKGGGVTLLVGSDGGIYSQNAAAGADFSNDRWGDGLNATISAVQPYDAEMAKDGTIVSGLQDNGEMKTAPNGREAEIFGGDAFFTTIDPNDSQNIIEEYTNASQVNLSKDGGASWYSITPSSSCGSSTTALFSTPIEQDPTSPGHVLIGCTQIQEATNAYANPCAVPPGETAGNCQATNSPFVSVFDLSTLPSPNGAPNIPSAVGVQGPDEYVGYCGYCDPATQGIPFGNGIATNVGGSSPPQIGSSAGWHQARALCRGCQTANGKLPERYINSIQEDPNDPNTVYVTLGGYGRRWIPPGSFGEGTSNVGVGHVFVSHDHGEHFTNITGNLPDISANWTAFHRGQLIVATDLGVYVQTSAGTSTTAPTYAVLGSGLPNAPVFTARISPADPNRLLVATFGRGDWEYEFPASSGGGHGGRGGRRAAGHRCPRPTGRITGTQLGPLHLGSTARRARATLDRVRVTHNGFDDFCLRGGRIRAGYPTGALLRSLSRRLRRQSRGRVAIALTANRFYALNGVRHGARLGAVAHRLRVGRPFHIGLNFWYIVPRHRAYGVLKVRRGHVQEVGLIVKRLAAGRAAQRRLLRSFGSG